MLTQVEVYNDQGALLTLPLQDISAGYLIKEIEGLDPVKATIVSSEFALIDGAQYQSSRLEKRNIVIKLGLSPDYSLNSVRELRRRLYSFFMPKSSLNLDFLTSDFPTVRVSGWVESFESPIFSKEPEVVISILCLDPSFYELTSTLAPGNTTSTAIETLIDYKGSIESGIHFVLSVNRTISGFTIYDRKSNGITSSFEFIASLIAGDVVAINTVPGFKSCTLFRTGVTSSVLYGVAPYSDWIKLQPGINNMRIYAAGAAIPYSLDYVNKFGGL